MNDPQLVELLDGTTQLVYDGNYDVDWQVLSQVSEKVLQSLFRYFRYNVAVGFFIHEVIDQIYGMPRLTGCLERL